MSTIVDEAFQGASSLTSVTIPSSVQSFGARAFNGTAVTSIAIPSGVSTIVDEAFQGASNLVSVTFLGIPPTNVGVNIFSGIATLPTLLYLSGTAGWPTAGFNNAQSPLFTVTFANDGLGVTGDPAVATARQELAGGSLALSAVGSLSRTGYNFAGWATRLNGPALPNPFVPAQNITVHPIWALPAVPEPPALTEPVVQSPSIQAPGMETPVAQAPPLPIPLQQAINTVMNLTPSQAQRLSPSQLSALPREAVAAMSSYQIKALNPAQVAKLTSDQISAISPNALYAMKPKTLEALTVDQIRSLTRAQAVALRLVQINALGPTKQRIILEIRAVGLN